MSDSLAVRVVRAAFAVAPKSIALKAVRAELPDEKADTVAATLSQMSKAGKGPLIRVEGGDVLEYRTPLGFDFQSWLSGRSSAAPPKSPSSPNESGGNEGVQIVRILHKSGRRLAAHQIYEQGNFESRGAMMLHFPKLSDGVETPLFRERVGGANGTFYYAIREGFDVEAWLEEHGADSAPPAAAAGGVRMITGRDASNQPRPPLPQRAAVSPAPRAPAPAPAARQEPLAAHKPPAPPPPPRVEPEPDRRPEPEEPVITVQPLRAADACAELLRHAHAKLMEAAEVSSDPVVATRARQVRLLNELREEFAPVVPA